jgi:hypothetical protein
MKLPASEFDEIYEACMASGGGEGGQYKGHTFYGNVWHRAGQSTHSEYVRAFGGLNKDLLETYRTGEIRDAGPYPHINIKSTWCECFKYGMYGQKCTCGETPQQKYLAADITFYNEGELVGHRIEHFSGMAAFDRVDVRYCNPVEPNYDHAFSVKDGRMVVDWDALEVTKENALEISIASWKWLYEWLNENEGRRPYRDAGECALCKKHGGCKGCPIEEAGGDACEKTPYVRYLRATNKHEALDACRDEIAFLEGLR